MAQSSGGISKRFLASGMGVLGHRVSGSSLRCLLCKGRSRSSKSSRSSRVDTGAVGITIQLSDEAHGSYK